MKHKCPNRFAQDGARGGCFFQIETGEKDETAVLDVGWSCVVVHRGEIPISWLAELVAIATQHPQKIAGFLKEHGIGGADSHPVAGQSYALMCDPPA